MSNLSYHQPKLPLDVGPNKRLLLRTISGHQSYVTSVAFFGSLRDRVITGSYDEVAKLWDLKTGRCLRKFSGHTDGITAVMPGPHGRVVTASEDRTVRVWDIETGECTRVIRSHSGAVTGLCMANPDRIVTGSTDKKLRVFDAAGSLCGEGELDGEIMAVAPAFLPATPCAGKPRRTDIVTELFQASDTTGGESTGVGSGDCGDNAGAHASSPAQVTVIACGGLHIPFPARPMVFRVEVSTSATNGRAVAADAADAGLCTSVFTGGENTGIVTSVAVSAAGVNGEGVLVCGSYDKRVRVLRNIFMHRDAGATEYKDFGIGEHGYGPPDVEDYITVQVVGSHKDGVRSVAISSDGRWAVSGGREGRIKVWELLHGSLVARRRRASLHSDSDEFQDDHSYVGEFEAHRGVVFSLCMSPDARVLLSAGSDNDVRVWDLALLVYARRLALNRLRGLWSAGRIRRARAKRNISGSGTVASPSASQAFGKSREHRQHILENLFALPDTVYAKILKYV